MIPSKAVERRKMEMGFTVENIGAGGRGNARYWDEDDYRAGYQALTDACWVYQYRNLEQNLRRFGWRQARRRSLKNGALSREWADRGHGDLRLTRGGLGMRFESGIRVISWKELKEMIEARRS